MHTKLSAKSIRELSKFRFKRSIKAGAWLSDIQAEPPLKQAQVFRQAADISTRNKRVGYV